MRSTIESKKNFVPCRSCRETVFWVTVKGGRQVPLNPEPENSGTLVLMPPVPDMPNDLRARLLDADDLFDRSLPRYVSHYRTCTQAPEWRRKQAL